MKQRKKNRNNTLFLKNASKVFSKASCRHKRWGAFLLCIVDPFNNPHKPYSFHKDSSHLLLKAFQEKGYRVFLSDPTQLFLTNSGSFANAWETTVLDQEPYFQYQNSNHMALDQFRLILMRKDPPVDISYLTATHILAKAAERVPIINDPYSLQRWNEKLIIFNFPKYIPPTCVSAHKEVLNHFIHSLKGDCILKPLDGFAGQGIQKITTQDENYWEKLTAVILNEKQPVVAQKFLPQITEGEKRVFMVDGKPMGAFLKKPLAGNFIANPDLGATLARTPLTPKEKNLCQEVGPWLKKQKIFFAGLDLIGEQLTEINITSPGLIWEWNHVDNKRYEEEIVAQIEKKFL